MFHKIFRASQAVLAGVAMAVVGAPGVAAAGSSDVRFSNGDIALAGELMLPRGDGPFPAIVVAQGSGDSDRTNQWSRDVSQVFLDCGMAVLLTDKRGSGASGGKWNTSSMEDLAGDSLAGITYLRARPEIDRARIGIVGLSQGGKYAPQVAVMDDDVSFVVSVSSDALTFVEQQMHEMRNDLHQMGLPAPIIDSALPMLSAAARYTLNGDWARYQAARNAASGQLWAPVAQAFPASADDPRWEFWGKTGRYDPIVYWSVARQPALILLGALDEQNNVAVGETVHRLRFAFAQAGKTNFQIEVFPNSDHDGGFHREPEAARSAVRKFLITYGLADCAS